MSNRDEIIPEVAMAMTISHDLFTGGHRTQRAAQAYHNSSGQGKIVEWEFHAPPEGWPSPEHELMAAQLLQVEYGFAETLGRGRMGSSQCSVADVRRDWAWMLNNSECNLMDFVNVCDNLGIAPTRLRAFWIAKYGKAAERLMAMKIQPKRIVKRLKLFCVHGHARTPENVDTQGNCRTCKAAHKSTRWDAERRRAYYAEHREERRERDHRYQANLSKVQNQQAPTGDVVLPSVQYATGRRMERA